MITVYGFRTDQSTAIGLTEKGKRSLERADGFETFEEEISSQEVDD